jgi:hypothetical protein
MGLGYSISSCGLCVSIEGRGRRLTVIGGGRQSWERYLPELWTDGNAQRTTWQRFCQVKQWQPYRLRGMWMNIDPPS